VTSHSEKTLEYQLDEIDIESDFLDFDSQVGSLSGRRPWFGQSSFDRNFCYERISFDINELNYTPQVKYPVFSMP
jgi:hypothetical protein